MIIYTDASVDQLTGETGIGIVIEKGMKKRTLSIPTMKFATNNEAEIYGVYLGCILAGGHPATIRTDSQTALSYIKGEVRDKPRTHEQYIRHKHLEFWAYKINHEFDNIKFEKVKGHDKKLISNSLNNNLSDVLAKLGRTRNR